MNYIELKIYTSRQGIEAVTAMLMEHGITETVVNDPAELEEMLKKKETYEWDYVDDAVLTRQGTEPTVSVYFEDTEAGRAQMQAIKLAVMMLKGREIDGEFGQNADLGRLYAEELPAGGDEWKDKWKEHFKPTRVTEHLVIKPTWEAYTAKEGELILEIDPGMAFGTGTHETTSMCLALIEKYRKDGFHVLDVGCGSGILSIGAALLGSPRVLGVEIDSDAVCVARENVKQNHVEDRVTVTEGDLTKGIDFQADLIVANLMADLVMRLSEDVQAHLKDGGIYLSSGILIEKKEPVTKALEKAGFTVLEIMEKGDWCAIAAAVK